MSAEKDESIPPKMAIFICGTKCSDQNGHEWNGPTVKIENGESATCSKCGVSAIDWSLMNLP